MPKASPRRCALAATSVLAGVALAGVATAQGITLHDWSQEDRQTFRSAARDAWEGWAEKTPEAREIVDSHQEFMSLLGLTDGQTE